MSKPDMTKQQPEQPRRTTFGEVVAILPTTEVLTDAIKGFLDGGWGSQDIETILAMSQFEMTKQLLAILTDEHFSDKVRFDVANELYAKVHRLFPGTSTSAQPAQVHVTIDKTPGQMSLKELLTYLEEDHGRYGELKAFIEANRQLQPVLQKTANQAYAWVIPNADGKGIDVELTMEYIDPLIFSLFARPQEIFQGRRPITLKRAVGKDLQAIIHPFLGVPVFGPDDLGFDFSDLHQQRPELVEALLWARIHKHPAWPTQITDLYGLTQDLFDNADRGRWPRIIAAYQAAVENDSTQRVNAYWPKDLGLDQIYGFGVTVTVEVHDEAYYRRLVEDAASLNGSLTLNGSANDERGGVYTSVTVNGSAHDVKKVVSLRGGSVNGSAHDVTVFLPPGVRMSINGSAHNVRQTNMTWRDLAKHLRLV